MSVWARDKQRRLVRVIPQRHSEESIVRHLFQENPIPRMDHPGNQQTLFNPNAQGLLGDPQRPHEPPRQGDGVTPSAILTAGGGNVNFQQNQYRAPPAPLPNVERTLREILQPQRTTTNSCICLLECLMKLKMIRLLPCVSRGRF